MWHINVSHPQNTPTYLLKNLLTVSPPLTKVVKAIYSKVLSTVTPPVITYP